MENLASYKQVDISKLLRAAVECVEDGDAIKVKVIIPPTGINEKKPIRIIGVDVSETVHPSQQSLVSASTRRPGTSIVDWTINQSI